MSGGKVTGLAVAALLAAAFVSSPGLAADTPCDAATSALSEAGSAWQDDAASGRDAGDTPQGAVLIPDSGYYWGYVDTVARDGADLNDWFEVALSGEQELVMAWVTMNYTALPYTTLRLELWAPGASAPTYATTTDDPPIEFANAHPGIWRLRLSPVFPPDARACADDASDGPSSPSPWPRDVTRVAQNYGIYFGCNPVCFRST